MDSTQYSFFTLTRGCSLERNWGDIRNLLSDLYLRIDKYLFIEAICALLVCRTPEITRVNDHPNENVLTKHYCPPNVSFKSFEVRNVNQHHAEVFRDRQINKEMNVQQETFGSTVQMTVTYRSEMRGFLYVAILDSDVELVFHGENYTEDIETPLMIGRSWKNPNTFIHFNVK